MSTPLVILMVLAGIGAAVGMRLAKTGAGYGRGLAAVCALLALVLAVAGIMSSGDENTPKIVKSLSGYNFACGHVVGSHLAEKYAGARVLVLVAPTFAGEDDDILQVSILEGLKQGMGSAVDLVEVVPVDPPPGYIEGVRESLAAGNVDLPPGTPDDWIPMLEREYSRWFRSRYFADTLKRHKGTYDILVSAVGLPRDFAESGLAKHSDLPETLVVLNDPDLPAKHLIGSGVVDVMVVDKPGINPWSDAAMASSNVAEDFDKRFLLVTKDNLLEVAQNYPQLPNLR